MNDSPSLRLPSAVSGRVLDTSGLVQLALGRTLYAQAFVRLATSLGLTWAVPSTALAEAWAQLPDKGRLALAVLVELGHTVIEPLDVHHAGPIGEILEDAPGFDVCAAHVVEIATRRNWPILTSRGTALKAVAPGLEIEPLP